MTGGMDTYFTDEKIEESVTKYNWEMVPSGDGKYKMRQRDKHYMTTVDFYATDETARKFCGYRDPRPMEKD